VAGEPKLIVGLGNPGIEYQFTYHNLGFLAVDRIAEDCDVQVNNRRSQALTASAKFAGKKIVLAKPETYMNLSGLAVRALVEELEIDARRDLIVLHDELDFSLGTIRVRMRGSSAGNNGIESIIGALGTEEFIRIRMGICPERKPADGKKYVLTQFKKSQYELIADMLGRTVDALKVILANGPETAMNRFNRKEQSGTETSGT
jgi:peptidyl-tRNA hydrolase, PTH1 family